MAVITIIPASPTNFDLGSDCDASPIKGKEEGPFDIEGGRRPLEAGNRDLRDVARHLVELGCCF